MMVTLSDGPVVDLPSTQIGTKLLFVMTLLSTPLTTADPLGLTKIPKFIELLETIVFDTEKLLDVLGEILIPAITKSLMTRFSMARFPPALNWTVPSPSMVRPRRWTLSPTPALIVTCPRKSRWSRRRVDDADRLGDGDHAIAGGVEHVDLAAGGGLGEREGKSLARCGARARAAVGSHSRNPSPVWPRLRWRGGKAAGEKSRGDR
jgi:hypothetical protein